MNPNSSPDKSARLTRNLDIFPLEPASRSAVSVLVGIALFCDGLAIFIFVAGGFRSGSIFGLAILLAVSGMFFWFAIAQRTSSVVLSDRDLML